MTWDRWTIGQKNIFYDEDIQSRNIPAAPYPSHVEDLRESMLDFSFPTLGYRDEENVTVAYRQRATDSHLMPASRIQNEANNIHNGCYMEEVWWSFFKDQFFKPLKNSVSVSRENSRRISRCNYFYDDFLMDSNRIWDTFSDKANDTDELHDFEKQKCPKPDVAFHLPLYHLDAETRIPRIVDSTVQQWNKIPHPSLVETFSWSTHRELFSYGLRSTPIRVFHKEPKAAMLISYPWLIVEHKKEGAARLEETVNCQAANGSACAIQMNAIAARYAMELDSHAEIPPIPTITTIGKDVKVWITYFSKKFWARCNENYYTYDLEWRKCEQGYVMQAMWKGDMTKIEDIIQFQLILDNIHTWAMRVYKPLMSSYIRQWIQVHCRSGVVSADAALIRRQQMLERCQVVVPMVQGVLENHSSIELDYGKHSMVTPLLLSLIVKEVINSERQALVNEIDSMIAKRLSAKDVGSIGTSHDTQLTSQRQQTEVSEAVYSHETVFSRTTTFDHDDLDDRDYEEPHSNKKTRIVPQFISASDSQQGTAELRRSTRLNPQTASPVHISDGESNTSSVTDGKPDNLETQESEDVSQPRAASCNSSSIDSSANSDDQLTPTGSTSCFASPTGSSIFGSPLDRQRSSSKGRSSGELFDLNSVPSGWNTRVFLSSRSSPGSSRTSWAPNPESISFRFGPSSPLQMDHRESGSESTQSPTPRPARNSQETASQSTDEQRKSEIPDSQDSTYPALS